MSSNGNENREDDASVSEDESYFSSKYEPEYLTRLSLAVGKDAKASAKDERNSTRSGHSKAQRSSTSTRASTTTTASTLSSLSFQSDDVVFNFPVPPLSPGFEPSQQVPYQLGSLTHLPKSPKQCAYEQDWTHRRTSSDASGALPHVPQLSKPPRRVRKKPAAAQLKEQATMPPATRCRTASDASEALPRWMAAQLPVRVEVPSEEKSDSGDEHESEFVKKFRARLCAPERQRRAAFGNRQQTARQALAARDAAVQPSKSKVTVTSPALANKLGF